MCTLQLQDQDQRSRRHQDSVVNFPQRRHNAFMLLCYVFHCASPLFWVLTFMATLTQTFSMPQCNAKPSPLFGLMMEGEIVNTDYAVVFWLALPRTTSCSAQQNTGLLQTNGPCSHSASDSHSSNMYPYYSVLIPVHHSRYRHCYLTIINAYKLFGFLYNDNTLTIILIDNHQL